jgi:hypothetical protein
MSQISDNDNIILFCAFRYALGRRTYVVDVVVDRILSRWDRLPEYDKQLYCSEILEYAEKFGNLGLECDAKNWGRILDKALQDGIIENYSL